MYRSEAAASSGSDCSAALYCARAGDADRDRQDGSGAVLPGVTVEASSPALIEKTKSAVTDGTGQYRIIDLRPGTYKLTFTLPGFNTVKREDVELAGTQTLTIPIDMRVGGLEETITVTAKRRWSTCRARSAKSSSSHDVIESLPATRAAGALLNITPGVNVEDERSGALSPTMTVFNARSSSINSGSVGRRRSHDASTASRWRRRAAAASLDRLRHRQRRGSRHHRRRRAGRK